MTASLDPWMSESEGARGVLVTEDFLGNALLKEAKKKTETFVNIKVVALCSVTHKRYLNMQLPSPLLLLSGSLTSPLIWTCPAIAFHRASSYLSQPQQECQGERGSAGASEGPMKNDWQSVEGGMPLMEEKKINAISASRTAIRGGLSPQQEICIC